MLTGLLLKYLLYHLSTIQEYLWAIGSQAGATDMQNFTSVGLDQIGTNDNLSDSLFHNHTYYITLRAINGAGLTTTIQCPGKVSLPHKVCSLTRQQC